MEEAERRLLARTRNDLGRVIPACKSEIFDLKDRQERFFNELVVHGGINYARQLAQVPEDLFAEWMADPEFKRRVVENIRGVLERYIDEVAETGKRKPEYIAERRGMVGALNNNRDAFYKAFDMTLRLYPELFPSIEAGKGTVNVGVIVKVEYADNKRG